MLGCSATACLTCRRQQQQAGATDPVKPSLPFGSLSWQFLGQPPEQRFNLPPARLYRMSGTCMKLPPKYYNILVFQDSRLNPRLKSKPVASGACWRSVSASSALDPKRRDTRQNWESRGQQVQILIAPTPKKSRLPSSIRSGIPPAFRKAAKRSHPSHRTTAPQTTKKKETRD